jgi:hypothetical protein
VFVSVYFLIFGFLEALDYSFGMNKKGATVLGICCKAKPRRRQRIVGFSLRAVPSFLHISANVGLAGFRRRDAAVVWWPRRDAGRGVAPWLGGVVPMEAPSDLCQA